MGKFYLPKGSVVKHGTSLCRLEQILKNGLETNQGRGEVRDNYELSPETNGIYIGELTSYFGAYNAYSYIIHPHLRKPENGKLYGFFYKEPKRILSETLTELPLTLPIVLSIQLEENCLLYADEDFVFDGNIPADVEIPAEILINEAETVWRKWKSGCIVRENGIPASWIKAIEHPRIGNLSGSLDLHNDTWADCALFSAGAMQSTMHNLPVPLLDSIKNSFGRTELSQKTSADEDGLSRILNLSGMKTINNQYFTHIQLTTSFDTLAMHNKIPLY